MPITVYSPHDGEPVKVRDQDIGRAVKDRQGRTFFVVLKSDSSDYYAALTRHGSEKDEARYAKLEEKLGTVGNQVKQQHEAAKPKLSSEKKGGGGLVKWVVLIIVLAALGWLFSYGPLGFLGEQAVEQVQQGAQNLQPSEGDSGQGGGSEAEPEGPDS